MERGGQPSRRLARAAGLPVSSLPTAGALHPPPRKAGHAFLPSLTRAQRSLSSTNTGTGGSRLTVAAAAAAGSGGRANTWHVVRYGETLSEIAEAYGVSVSALRAANDTALNDPGKEDVVTRGGRTLLRKTDIIFEGQRLKLPVSPTPTQTVPAVQAGGVALPSWAAGDGLGRVGAVAAGLLGVAALVAAGKRLLPPSPESLGGAAGEKLGADLDGSMAGGKVQEGAVGVAMRAAGGPAEDSRTAEMEPAVGAKGGADDEEEEGQQGGADTDADADAEEAAVLAEAESGAAWQLPSAAAEQAPAKEATEQLLQAAAGATTPQASEGPEASAPSVAAEGSPDRAADETGPPAEAAAAEASAPSEGGAAAEPAGAPSLAEALGLSPPSPTPDEARAAEAEGTAASPAVPDPAEAAAASPDPAAEAGTSPESTEEADASSKPTEEADASSKPTEEADASSEPSEEADASSEPTEAEAVPAAAGGEAELTRGIGFLAPSPGAGYPSGVVANMRSRLQQAIAALEGTGGLAPDARGLPQSQQIAQLHAGLGAALRNLEDAKDPAAVSAAVAANEGLLAAADVLAGADAVAGAPTWEPPTVQMTSASAWGEDAAAGAAHANGGADAALGNKNGGADAALGNKNGAADGAFGNKNGGADAAVGNKNGAADGAVGKNGGADAALGNGGAAAGATAGSGAGGAGAERSGDGGGAATTERARAKLRSILELLDAGEGRTSGDGAAAARARSVAKGTLVELCLGTSRGLAASPEARGEIEDLTGSIEASSPTAVPTASLEALHGRWKLVYTSNAQALMLLGALASLRVVSVGNIYQIVDAGALTVENKMDLSVPWLMSVVSQSTMEVRTPKQFKVRLVRAGLDTRVRTPQVFSDLELPSSVSLLGNDIDLGRLSALLEPVNSGLQGAQGLLSAVVRPTLDLESLVGLQPSWMLTTYMDDTLRIARDDAQGLFVFVKDEVAAAPAPDADD